MPDAPPAPATPSAIPAAINVSAPNAEWASPHSLVAGTARSNLQGLQSGANWSRLLQGAAPGALLAGGTAWLTHKLLADQGETEEEKERKTWQRRLLTLGAGLAGAYGGANAKWKYTVAPELRQGLAKSVFNPRQAFAEGLHTNYKPDVARASQAIQKAQPLHQRAVDWLADRYYVPGAGSMPAWTSTIGGVADAVSSAGAARYYRRDGTNSVEDSPGVAAFSKLWDQLEHNRVRDALTHAGTNTPEAGDLREQLAKYRSSLGLNS